MPHPAKPTTKEEDAFMRVLLADFDNHACDTVLSSQQPRESTSTPHASVSENVISQRMGTRPALSLCEMRHPPLAIPYPHSHTTVKDIDSHNKPSKDIRQENCGRVDVTKSHKLQPALPPMGLLKNDVDMGDLLAGAEDWDMNMVMSDEETSTNTSTTHVEDPSPFRVSCTRCVVKRIDSTDHSEKRLIVEVRGLAAIEEREVVLKQDWMSTNVAVGDIINVLGEFTPFLGPSSSKTNPTLTITVTSRANMVILHPDLLISSTTVANARSCSRKPLLTNLLNSNAPSPPTPINNSELACEKKVERQFGAMIWGNFLHEVVQRCLQTGRWDKQWIEACVNEVVTSPEGLGELVKLGVNVDKAKSEIMARGSGLGEFGGRYVGQTIKSDALLTDLHNVSDVAFYLALTKLHCVEEDIWSPTYGLKGKLDASVQALIEQRSRQSVNRNCPMPFEIKTGHAVGILEHRAQTILYSLLMGERYGVEVQSGLLFYTHSKDLMRVSAKRNELRGLIVARNELASYMMRKRTLPAQVSSTTSCASTFLPPTIDDEYKCASCYVVDGCMLYRKAADDRVDDRNPISSLYAKKTSHLTSPQCEFFKKWEELVTLEEQDAVRFRKELWTLTAKEREKTGRCFANMIVQEYKCDVERGTARVHRHVYRFARLVASISSQEARSSLLSGNLSAGDAVIISIEPGLLAVARGFVVEVLPHCIVVGFDHEVDLPAILKRTRSINKSLEKILCRIDKDEFAGGMGKIRDNLARLFYVGGDKKRLSLIVDLAAPAFTPDVCHASELPLNLNHNQQEAVRKVLSSKDYTLVLGMPGTGKTTTIAEMINVLVRRGNTVLLASYTHSAVDNILLKLNDVDFPILRLGTLDKVHPGVHKYTLASQTQPTTVEQLEFQTLRPPVVATTCLSLDHALFARRYFDFCIIDEASQVTLPTCLGPLRYAKKFVLVGDHFQLPPLVRSRDARAGGLDVSLFRRLADAHPAAVVELVDQYRMNDDIMLLSNKLIYGGRLQSGSQYVARQSLVLPNKAALAGSHTEACRDTVCWMEKLLDENCRAIFVDTDNVPGTESHVGDLVQNEVEAKLVYNVTEAFLLSGIKPSQIGIITLYRQQIKLLSHYLHGRSEIEILTADKSQGRDKDCIIISLVRSNAEGQIGDLLKDWRRINVAFTRARSKLIIFGSSKTLRAAPVLKEFFDLMEERGWIMVLPPGAGKVHTPPVDVNKPTSKRHAEVGLEEKENGNRKEMKRVKTERGVLKGRPLLRDVVNNTK